MSLPEISSNLNYTVGVSPTPFIVWLDASEIGAALTTSLFSLVVEATTSLNAKIENVGWDVAFQTLLDMKTLVADVDTNNGIIRVHTPEKLTAQETAKSARAEVLKKKIQLEESVEPILAEYSS